MESADAFVVSPSRLDLATKLGAVSGRVRPPVHVKEGAAEHGLEPGAMFSRDGRSPSWSGHHLSDGWWIVVYPEAGEAVATFRRAREFDPEPGNRFAADAEGRGLSEAIRRARSAVRRYCAANRLDRLGTLTYRGDGCHDELRVRADVATFFRVLRHRLGAGPYPYLWAAEWHPGGHGLHAHFAVGRFIDKAVIAGAWEHGFVEIRRLNEGLHHASELARSRVAAAYLGKYVSKSFERTGALHRYEVAQGFQPRRLRFFTEAMEVAVQFCVELRGGALPRFSLSDEWQGWQGPPTVWMQWAS